MFSLSLIATIVLSISAVSAYGYGNYYDDYSTYSKTVVKDPWGKTVEISKNTPSGSSYYYSSKNYRHGRYGQNSAYNYWKGPSYYPDSYYKTSYHSSRYYPVRYNNNLGYYNHRYSRY